MDSPLAISPRNLGLILVMLFCPRCFWFLMRMKFHPPFDKGGGAIWTYLQQIQEAQIGLHLDRNGCLPKEFAPFCDIKERIEYPKHWSKFRYQHKSGIVLYGVPDELFRLSNGGLCVIDHKSAINKGKDDPFLPIYHSQTVGYGDIAQNGLDLGTVTKGGLLYWEIQREPVIAKPGDHYEQGNVWIPFAPKPLELEMDPALLDAPLKIAKSLWLSETPPEGREGCKDCFKTEALLALGGIAEGAEEAKDRNTLATFGNYPVVVKDVLKRRFHRKHDRIAALADLQSMAIDFDSDGIASHWEFPGEWSSQE